MIALVLVILTMLLLVGSVRATIVAGLSLMTVMIAAGFVVLATGATMNAITIVGLAVAALLVIDDSIRNVDGLTRPGDRTAGLVRSASSNVASFGFAAVILAVSLTPALWMVGVAGKFVPSIVAAVAIALALAFVVSITVTPALASLVFARLPGGRAGRRPASAAEQRYAPLLHRVLAKPKGAALAGVALLAVAAAMIPVLEREFMPQFRQTDVIVSFEAAPGVSLQESRRIATTAAHELAQLPGVAEAGSQIGRAILSDEITEVDRGVIWLSLDPSTDYDATIASVRNVIVGYPGFGTPEISSYTNDRVRDELQQAKGDLVVRVYGEDPEQLTPLALELAGSVATVDGVADARADLPVLAPAVEIDVDLDRAAEALIKPGDARRAAATVFAGIEVGSLFEEQRVFEVVVWSKPEYRNSVSSVESLPIDTPTGKPVTLGSVADISIAPNQRVIERHSVSRYVDVVVDVPERNIDAVRDDVKALVAARGLPYEFHVGYLANGSDSRSNTRSVVLVGVAAAMIIFLLLQAALSSWRLATMLTSTTLAALAGSMVAIALDGRTYSVGSLAGLVLVGGLTLRGGLALLMRYSTMQVEGDALGLELVTTGAHRQFASTFASSVAIIVATIPFLVFGTEAGLEILRPFAVAVLGGTITAAVINLFVLPSIYHWIARPTTPDEDLHRPAPAPAPDEDAELAYGGELANDRAGELVAH